MSRLWVIGISMAILWIGPTVAAQAASTDARGFLQRLEGGWQGQAVETPVGVLNYDMRFRTCADGALVAVANPGGALHYWRFVPTHGQLRLVFLSTFAGNQTPVFLRPRRLSDKGGRFFALNFDKVGMVIDLTQTLMSIQVLHFERPHVRIELRPAPSAADAYPRLCEELPAPLLGHEPDSRLNQRQGQG